MKDYVVWIDSKVAHIYFLSSSGIKKTIIKKNNKDHHTRHKNDQHQDNHAEQYYHILADQLKSADQLLIMGAGLAKNHFNKYLLSHFKNTVAQKIIGFEKIDSFHHNSEKQMMAKANKIFRAYELFKNK